MTKTSYSEEYIDLRGTPCPKNFIICNLALEKLNKNDFLQVDLDRGEPELMVIPGLKNAGHFVEIICEESNWLRIKVTCGVVE